jgi:hypothetical protein
MLMLSRSRPEGVNPFSIAMDGFAPEPLRAPAARLKSW